MALRIDSSQNRNLYVGTGTEVAVNDGNAIVTGNVGVGTTSPGAKLHVDNSAASLALHVSRNGGGAVTNAATIVSGAAVYINGNESGGSDALRIGSMDNSTGDYYIDVSNYAGTASYDLILQPFLGNVGIGTTSPSQKLHLHNGTLLIDSDAGISSGIWMPDLNGNPSLRIVTDQSSAANSSIVNAWGNSSNAGVMVGSTRNDGFAFQVRSGVTLTNGFANDTGNSRMVVLGNGNVGIGTTSPDGKLEIVQTSGDGTPTLIVANDISGVSGYTFQSWRYVDGNTNFRLDLKQKTLSGVVKYAFDMVNNGTGFNDVLVLDRGKVGIGTSSPAKKLHVKESTTATYAAYIENSVAGGDYLAMIGDAGDNVFEFDSGGTGGEAQMKMYSDGVLKNLLDANGSSYFTGSVGIGTTGSGFKLEVDTNGVHDGIKIRGANAPGLTLQDDSSASLSTILIQSTAAAQGNLRIAADTNNVATGATIEFQVSGSERMRISNAGAIKFNDYGAGTLVTDSSGNITVSSGGGAGGPYLPLSAGSSYPLTDTLYIQPTGSPTNTMLISARANDTYGNIQFTNAAETANWTELRSTSTQFTINNVNVGIGTTNPTQKLHLDGNNYNTATRTTFLIRDVGNNYNQGDNAIDIVMRSRYWSGDQNTSQNSKIRHLKDNSNGSTGTQLRFSTTTRGAGDSSDKMTILASGNVGIGETGPVNKLNVNGDIGYIGVIGQGNIYGNTGNSSYANMQLYDPATGYSTFNNQSYGYYLQTGGSTKLAILNNGNVGIGVTGPDSRLTVSSGTANNVANFKSTDGTAYIAISDNSSSSALGNQVGVVGDQMYFAVGDVERMRLVPDGNSTFVIIKAKPATYNSKSFITLYGTNSSTYGGSVIARSSISSETDGSAYGANLKFYTNDSSNVEQTRITVLSDGNVGIGTATPDTLLHVKGGADDNESLLYIENTHSAGGTQYPSAMFTNTNGDHSFGTIAEFRTGNVSGNDRPSILFTNGVTTNNWSVGQGVYSANDNFAIGFRSGHPGVVSAWADPKLVILTSGNVGIGTTSPGSKLQVAGEIRVADGNKGAPSYTFTSDTNTGMYSDTADVIDFTAGGTKSLSVTTSGATVYGSALMPSNAAILLQNQNNNNQFYIRNSGVSDATFQVGQGAPGSNVRFFINGSGNVGIGNTASTASVKLEVTGNTLLKNSNGVGDLYLGNYATANHFRFHTNNANTYFDMNCGDIYWRQGTSTRYQFFPSTANMTVQGTITQNSDVRIKENVVEISDCISKVQAMRGVYYNRTDFNTGVTKVGVIAQEVEAVLPELVLESPETGLKSVAYSELTSVLINAIKEQQEIIEDLKTRITKLEN